MRRTLITTLAAFALSTGAAVAADTPDSVLIGGKVEVKLGDNQGNVLAALSTVYKLEPYTWETGMAFAVRAPEGKVVGTVAFDAKAGLCRRHEPAKRGARARRRRRRRVVRTTTGAYGSGAIDFRA